MSKQTSIASTSKPKQNKSYTPLKYHNTRSKTYPLHSILTSSEKHRNKDTYDSLSDFESEIEDLQSNISKEHIHTTPIQNQSHQNEIISELDNLHFQRTDTYTPDRQQPIEHNLIDKMELTEEQIQKKFIDFIADFDGTDSLNVEKNLAKFLGASDRVYNSLQHPNDLERFNQLIRFKLDGSTYTKIQRKGIEDYPALKATLNNMFSTTFSLSELEKNCFNIKQQYQEQLKTYGQRLTEALDQYKNGFKIKYGVQAIDNAHNRHLNEMAIIAFKKGLNNTILREKVATIRTQSLNEIIAETEIIEKMLIITNEDDAPYMKSITKPTEITKPIIQCGFCKRIGHTWNECRTRNRQQNRPQFNQYRNQNQTALRPNFNYQYPPIQNNQQYRYYDNQPARQYQAQPPVFQPQQRFTQPNYQQATYLPQNKPSTSGNFNKHCRYCRQSGHFIDECQAKRATDVRNNRAQQNYMNGITDQFSKIKINSINQQIPEIYISQPMISQPQNQGNDNGSLNH